MPVVGFDWQRRLTGLTDTDPPNVVAQRVEKNGVEDKRNNAPWTWPENSWEKGESSSTSERRQERAKWACIKGSGTAINRASSWHSLDP